MELDLLFLEAHRHGLAYGDQRGIQTWRLGQALCIDGAITTRNKNETDIFVCQFILSFFPLYSFSIAMALISAFLPLCCLYTQHLGFKKT